MKTDNRHWTSKILGGSTKGSLSLACAQAYVRMYSDLNIKMNLYLIRRDDWLDEIDYDEYRGHVIAAPNAETARCIAADQEGPAEGLKVSEGWSRAYELRWIWLTQETPHLKPGSPTPVSAQSFRPVGVSRTVFDPETGVLRPIFSTVTLLASDVDAKEGIVLSDYNAG